MRNLSLFIISALIATGCSPPDGRSLSLASAKELSAEFCSRSKDGCEYNISKTETGWTVRATLIVYAKDGKRGYLGGGDAFYDYDKDGKLQNAVYSI